MQTSDRAADSRGEPAHAAGASRRRRRGFALTEGGTDGNEQLTAITGAVLIVLLAVIGVTIVRIGQLISVHLFVGLLLIGPVTLKMASTGYRFVRYYTGNPAYHRKGPPELFLRLTAPVVVLSTLVVFASGTILLFVGRARRDQDSLLLIHKVSFIVWGVFTGLHVLGHLPSLVRSLRVEAKRGSDAVAIAGRGGRTIALAGALVGGIVLAIVLIPQFSGWSHHAAGSIRDH
jgi:hypothetical protein